jgi:hypothetical protein
MFATQSHLLDQNRGFIVEGVICMLAIDMTKLSICLIVTSSISGLQHFIVSIGRPLGKFDGPSHAMDTWRWELVLIETFLR